MSYFQDLISGNHILVMREFLVTDFFFLIVISKIIGISYFTL